jgi:hypothetical protein
MSTTSANQNTDDIWLNEYKDQLPTTLNVLTILTIIFNCFAFLTSFATFAFVPFGYRNAMENQATFDNMPPLVRSLLGNTQESARLAYVYRVPILLIGLTGAILCFVGAIQMRKRKKLGFMLYIAGDALPIINMFFFTVLSTLTGISMGIGLGIELLFVILYATQYK